MKIEHIAMYVKDLEKTKTFFEIYLNARANAGYYNPKTDFRSYFLSFDDGASCTASFKDDDCPLSLFPLMIIIAMSAMATTTIATPKEMMICFSFFFILFSSSLIISVNTICNSFCKHCLIMIIR